MNFQQQLLQRVIDTAKLSDSAAKGHFDRQCERSTEFLAAHSGKNPRKLVVQACPAGDPGLYHEIAVSIHKPNGDRIADILIGIDEQGNARVLVTSDGDGDGDHNIVIHPEKPCDEAVSLEGV